MPRRVPPTLPDDRDGGPVPSAPDVTPGAEAPCSTDANDDTLMVSVSLDGDECDDESAARDDAALSTESIEVVRSLDPPTSDVDGDAFVASVSAIDAPAAHAETDGTPPRVQATDAVRSEDETSGDHPGPTRAAPRSVSELHLRGIVESLVFVSDRPITEGELAKVARAGVRDVRRLLEELREDYRTRGLHLDELAGGWQFRSSAANAPFVRELLQARPIRLSRAQVETLAIMAYRQPITRPEIDEIRGVDSGSAIKVLLDRELVRILGRKEDVGRPVLYGTSTHFLEFFSLKSLRDLPALREFTELSPESEATLVRELGDELEPIVATVGPEATATDHVVPGDGPERSVDTQSTEGGENDTQNDVPVASDDVPAGSKDPNVEVATTHDPSDVAPPDEPE